MQTAHFFKSALLLAALTVPASLFTSCSKGDSGADNNPPVGSTPNFKPADFEVYNVTKEIDDPWEVHVVYYVKNTTTKNYVVASEDNFAVQWRVKGSDGAWYQAKEGIGDLSIGASAREELTIGVPPGMTPDIKTLEYEVIKN